MRLSEVKALNEGAKNGILIKGGEISTNIHFYYIYIILNRIWFLIPFLPID